MMMIRQRHLIFWFGGLTCLFILAGGGFAAWQYHWAQRYATQVEATSRILSATSNLQLATTRAMSERRFGLRTQQEAMDDLDQLVDHLKTSDWIRSGDLLWLDLQRSAVGKLGTAMADPRIKGDQRDFLRGRMALQVDELGGTAEILHRTALQRRRIAVAAIYRTGMIPLLAALVSLLLLLLLYRRHLNLQERYERERTIAHKQLRSYAEELEQYLYIASHDLKAPLRSISAYAELLEHDAAEVLGETSRRFLGEVRRGTARMVQLIDDLLQVARIDREQPADPGTVSAQAVAEDLAAIFAPGLTEAGASLTIGPLPAVRVDRTRFELVLQNLIGNAIKYRSPTRSLAIELSAREQDGWVCFRVRDNGRGIPPDQHDRVFRLFERLDQSLDVPGTGAGLALCKKSVEQWGGRIWIEAGVDTGTCFAFTVALEKSES